jgi:hypothetical protein
MASASFYSVLWTTTQIWQRVLLLAVVAMYAGVLGKGIGAAWTRMRLMRELLRLRRAAKGEATGEPARYTGRTTREAAADFPAVIDHDVERDNVPAQPVRHRRRRSNVDFRDARDLNRLLIPLFTHWKLPSVRIDVGGVAGLDVQRAQHRIARLTDSCDCELGAWLAGATVLGGAFYVEWASTQNWDWYVPESWGPLGLVFVAAPIAALIGTVVQKVWSRVRLLLVLRGVRHRLRA